MHISDNQRLWKQSSGLRFVVASAGEMHFLLLRVRKFLYVISLAWVFYVEFALQDAGGIYSLLIFFVVHLIVLLLR